MIKDLPKPDFSATATGGRKMARRMSTILLSMVLRFSVILF
jgi:hypothetical protein